MSLVEQPLDCDKLADVLTRLLRSYCAKLNNFLKNKATLQSFANEVFEAELITVELRDNPSYNEIERQFTSLLGCLSIKEEFEENCKKFLQALRKLGGMGVIANSLKDDWIRVANNELHVALNL